MDGDLHLIDINEKIEIIYLTLFINNNHYDF
jgi:hypothetical protein